LAKNPAKRESIRLFLTTSTLLHTESKRSPSN